MLKLLQILLHNNYNFFGKNRLVPLKQYNKLMFKSVYFNS